MHNQHVRGWDDNLPVGEERAPRYAASDVDDNMDATEDGTMGGEVLEGNARSHARSDEEGGSPVDESLPAAQSQPSNTQRRQHRQRGPARLEEDLLLLNETIAIFPYAMPRNQKRAGWETVAANVNLSLHALRHFKHRRARERVTRLLNAHKREELESLRASGIDEEYGKREQLLTNLAEQVADVEAQSAANQVEREVEERQAGLLREATMEGMRRATEPPGDSMDEPQPDASQGMGHRGRREGRRRGVVLEETLVALLQEDREGCEREATSQKRHSEALANHVALLERFLEQQDRWLDLEDMRLDLEERRITE